MKNYRLRSIDPAKDRGLFLEYNARVVYACESAPLKEKGYAAYRDEWLREENAKRLWALMLATLKDERNIAVVLESRDSVPFGYFWAVMEETSPSCLCLLINDVYIEEPYRKQGIALELFAHAEEHARKHGAQILRSGTGTGNEPSLSLHKKAGFSPFRVEFEKVISPRVHSS